MKILWASNAPWANTGYGRQTRLMLPRLIADGHEVVVAANWGLESGLQHDDETGVEVWPRGVDTYGNDVLYGIFKTVEADWIVSLYDVWVYKDPRFHEINFASWTPIDHDPISPEVLPWVQRHPTIAMSRFGQQSLASAGVQADYAPHAIDLGVWHPRDDRAEVRKALDVPDDAFLVMVNAANKGIPPRKAWPEMLGALAKFMRDHDDVLAYVHTDLEPVYGGLDLARLMSAVGIPPERLRVADRWANRLGLLTDEYLAQRYAASDVLLATSMGEGFGIPVIEAQACGTPVIVTDFSAQPELVGGGWTVPCLAFWDYTQGAFLGQPFMPRIVDALEQAYAQRGSESLRAAALAKAREYEVDKVYAEHWRPILANLEDRSTHKPRAQRRAERRKRK